MGEGGFAGPDLSMIGAARSAAHLRESLIDPQAAAPEDYLLVTAFCEGWPERHWPARESGLIFCPVP